MIEASEQVPIEPGTGQSVGTSLPATVGESGPQVAPSGRRQALRDLRRQLSDEELSHPGVQKLILDELERADAECEILRAYEDRFHDADKRAAILEEKLRRQSAFDILFSVMVGLGGAILGLAPLFWSDQPKGWLALLLGLALILGSTAGKVAKR